MRRLALVVVASWLAACGGAVSSEEEESADEAEARLARVEPNDVSMLFPLPLGKERDLLLSAASRGAHGELLSATTFAKLPQITNAVPAAEVRGTLRVVAVRFDPCFPGLGVARESDCKNQVRLVMQPTRVDSPDKTLQTEDAAVHLFFETTRAEFTTLVRDVLALKKAAGRSRKTPLGVQPIMKRQGLDGSFARGLTALVLAHTGESKLTRVTFMTREPSRQPMWHFGGFDVARGRMSAMKIATVSAAEQSVSNSGLGELRAQITPSTTSRDDIRVLLDAFAAPNASAASKRAAFDAALRIENPAKHSPETIDCASCHLATPARIMGEKKLGFTGGADRFASPVDLTNTSKVQDSANSLRGFGYLGADPAFGQRAVNETAAVVAYVNEKILGAR